MEATHGQPVDIVYGGQWKSVRPVGRSLPFVFFSPFSGLSLLLCPLGPCGGCSFFFKRAAIAAAPAAAEDRLTQRPTGSRLHTGNKVSQEKKPYDADKRKYVWKTRTRMRHRNRESALSPFLSVFAPISLPSSLCDSLSEETRKRKQ